MHFKYFSKVFAFEVLKWKVFAFEKNFKYILQIAVILPVTAFAAFSFFFCKVILFIIINVMYRWTQFNSIFYKYFYKSNKLKIFYLID